MTPDPVLTGEMAGLFAMAKALEEIREHCQAVVEETSGPDSFGSFDGGRNCVAGDVRRIIDRHLGEDANK